jgi:hypothetical protein
MPAVSSVPDNEVAAVAVGVSGKSLADTSYGTRRRRRRRRHIHEGGRPLGGGGFSKGRDFPGRGVENRLDEFTDTRPAPSIRPRLVQSPLVILINDRKFYRPPLHPRFNSPNQFIRADLAGESHLFYNCAN